MNIEKKRLYGNYKRIQVQDLIFANLEGGDYYCQCMRILGLTCKEDSANI